MAVTQVSRIQVRRGLQQDLPQLASAELGWSIDTRQLYIGNGTLEEGAPIIGVTEILTSQTDLTALLGTYTFVGNVAGYAAQTGSSVLNPTIRSFQQKFDDVVNVRDFGATGNGIDDDTVAINRALQQIYKSSVSPVEPRARRTIYFPGGTYLTSNTIQIPPYAKIVGDGTMSSVIKLQYGNLSVANVTDSGFNAPSVSSTLLPSFIEIHGIKLQNTSTQVTQPILNLDSAANLRFQNVQMQSNVTAGYYPNLVHITSTVQSSRGITFDNCIFNNGGNGISILGSGVRSVRLVNSEFDGISNTAIDMGSVTGLMAIGNYYGNVGAISSKNSAIAFSAIGEIYSTAAATGLEGGYFGNLTLGSAKAESVSTSATYILGLTTTIAGAIDYEISNSSARRFGTFNFSSNGSSTIFNDDYTEGLVSINANLYANANSVICTLSSGTGTFKYSLKHFI